MRPRKFFFHYNKPASQAAGRNVLTVHFKGVCHLVNTISCMVPVRSRDRRTQPRCVIEGLANSVTFIDGMAVIT